MHDSGHSSELVLGDLRLPESAAFRVQVQVRPILILAKKIQALPLQLDPCRNETPDFLLHASVCRSERQTILPP